MTLDGRVVVHIWILLAESFHGVAVIRHTFSETMHTVMYAY